MRTVFNREFFSAFKRLYGYIALGVMILVSAILFIFYNLLYTTENINSVTAGMSVFAAIVIPVIAVNAFPSRKKENTDAVYDMMPLSTKDVILGKYLAAWAIIMIPNVLIAIYSVLGGIFSDIDHIASYTSLLGLILMESAWLAVCMFIAKKSNSRVVAYIISYAVGVVWYFLAIVSVLIPTSRIASLIGFAVVALGAGALLWLATRKIAFGIACSVTLEAALAVAYIVTPESFAGLLEAFIDKLSIFAHFNAFSYGLLDFEGIVFFLLLTSVFLFLVWREHEKSYQTSERKKGSMSRSFAALAIVAALLVNVAFALIPDRFMTVDATLANKNSVSDEAKAYLATVDKEITVYLLEPTKLEDYELYLTKIVGCSDSITLKKVYNADTPEFYTERNINIDSVVANSLVFECGDKVNYLSYYDLFAYYNDNLGSLSYNEYVYYAYMFTTSEDYYDYYHSLLYESTVYFNADYMICTYVEYTAADMIPAYYYLTGHGEQSIDDSKNPYYGMAITELNITESDIPADAASIFVNMPDGDISEGERDKLITYLANGGQVTFVTNTANLSMPNLCAVLAEYGMSASGTVVESAEVGDGESETEESEEAAYSTEISVTVNTDNDILYELDSVTPTLTEANAISVDTKAKESLTVIPMFVSPSDCYILENGDDVSASYTVACAVETPSGARLAWFTGGESFDSSSSDQVSAVAYALTWTTLTYKSAVSDVPACVYSVPTTEITSAGASFLSVMLVLIPIALMVFGGISFYIRKRSK